MNSPLKWKCIFEICYNLIHCPPYVTGDITIPQQSDDYTLSIEGYISILMLGRLYSFQRIFDHYSYWTNQRAIRVGRINNFLPSSGFAIKAYLKYKNEVILAIALIGTVFLFGFEVRVFEIVKNVVFTNLLNAFWIIIVTMSTGNSLRLVDK